VHYHFPDKDSLLVACAERLTSELITAEASALSESTAGTVLDDLWGAFVAFAQRGAHRALIALATETTEPTRAALAAAMARRHAAAERTLGRVVDLLGFATPVSRHSLAAAYVGLTDGIALDIAVRPDRDHRPAFDAFWLAVLSLGTT
jgi:AcrR family transcriptional regulator